MSAPGVLAVMDETATWAQQVADRGGIPQGVRQAANGQAYRQRQARATVAELIAADKAVDEVEDEILRVELAGPRKGSYGTGWETRDAAHARDLDAKLHAAHERRAKALIRAGGDA